MDSKKLIGVVQVLLSGMTYGFVGVLGKFAYAAGLTPGQAVSLRFLVAAASLGLLSRSSAPGGSDFRSAIFWSVP
jgi:hypothetical protein